MSTKLSDPVQGKIVRMSWVSGPTAGAVHEHDFHADGTVMWHTIADYGALSRGTTDALPVGGPATERAPYAAVSVTDDVCLVSYLSGAGYTLTVALNFNDGTATGFASSGTTWAAVRGTFEVMHRRAAVPAAEATRLTRQTAV
jgi:hypothetical protein